MNKIKLATAYIKFATWVNHVMDIEISNKIKCNIPEDEVIIHMTRFHTKLQSVFWTHWKEDMTYKEWHEIMGYINNHDNVHALADESHKVHDNNKERDLAKIYRAKYDKIKSSIIKPEDATEDSQCPFDLHTDEANEWLGKFEELNSVKTRKKCIKTKDGYLAIQGDTTWFEDKVTGWVLTSTDYDHLAKVANHFLPSGDYSIVNVDRQN